MRHCLRFALVIFALLLVVNFVSASVPSSIAVSASSSCNAACSTGVCVYDSVGGFSCRPTGQMIVVHGFVYDSVSGYSGYAAKVPSSSDAGYVCYNSLALVSGQKYIQNPGIYTSQGQCLTSGQLQMRESGGDNAVSPTFSTEGALCTSSIENVLASSYFSGTYNIGDVSAFMGYLQSNGVGGLFCNNCLSSQKVLFSDGGGSSWYGMVSCNQGQGVCTRNLKWNGQVLSNYRTCVPLNSQNIIVDAHPSSTSEPVSFDSGGLDYPVVSYKTSLTMGASCQVVSSGLVNKYSSSGTLYFILNNGKWLNVQGVGTEDAKYICLSTEPPSCGSGSTTGAYCTNYYSSQEGGSDRFTRFNTGECSVWETNSNGDITGVFRFNELNQCSNHDVGVEVNGICGQNEGVCCNDQGQHFIGPNILPPCSGVPVACSGISGEICCGNGVVEAISGEECDNATNNGVTCVPQSGRNCTYCSSSTNPGGIQMCKKINVTSVVNGMCSDAPRGLAGYWRFDGDLGDSSGRGNHGTTNFLMSYGNGKLNKSLSFDGQRYFSADLSSMDESDYGFSYGFWIKGGSGSKGVILSNGNYGGDIYIARLSSYGFISFEISAQSNFISVQSAQSVNSLWHYVFVTYDGSELKLYFDGVLDSSGVWDGSRRYEGIFSNQVSVGSDTTYTANNLNASLDELTYWNRALGENEVGFYYNSSFGRSGCDEPLANGYVSRCNLDKGLCEIIPGVGGSNCSINRDCIEKCSPVKEGLVGYWRFDGNARDSSGNGNKGVISGGVSFTDGLVGGAAVFDGISGNVFVQSSSSVKSISELTVSAWVNASSDLYVGSIFSRLADPYGWSSIYSLYFNAKFESSDSLQRP